MTDLILYKPLYPFQISQRFGENQAVVYKTWGILGHPGLDCVRPAPYLTEGCNVRAACEGTVSFVGKDANNAYGVVIITDNTYSYKGLPGCSLMRFKLIYWHILPNPPVKVGDKVEIGDVIATASHTGTPGLNPHLHFGMKPVANGESTTTWYDSASNNGYNGNIDPEPYLSAKSAYEYIQSNPNG